MRHALLLLAAAAIVTPQPNFFHYERPITVSNGVAGQVCTRLESNVFAHAAPDLADLRLFHGSTETPYALQIASEPTNTGAVIDPLNLGTRGGKTVFDATMPAGTYTDLELNIGRKDFLSTVDVSGSREDGGATTRLGTFTVFDFSREKLGRSTVLHLSPSDFHFLHFELSSPILPNDIKGLTIRSRASTSLNYVEVVSTSQAVQKGQTSVFEVNVPANVPVDRITFFAGAEPTSFTRDVTVSIALKPRASDESETPEQTQFIGNILRLHRLQEGEKIDEERLSVDTSGQVFDRPSTWTIVIQNGDDPPLPLGAVRLEMLERDLCFEASAGGNYTLFYGDPALGKPHYDYAALFSLNRNVPRAYAGPEQVNPNAQARPDERPFTEKHPALLWSGLVAVFALLGGLALKSSRRTGSSA